MSLKVLRVVVAALCFSFCYTGVLAWESPNFEEVVGSSIAGLVQIIVSGTDKDGRPIATDYGSGFIVSDDGYVLTAAHMIPRDGRALTVRGRSGYLAAKPGEQPEDQELDTINVDYGKGVAILKFKRLPPGARPLPLGGNLPTTPGKTLYKMGFPGGQLNPTHYPVIFQSSDSLGTKFQYQGLANHGDSGGPILDDFGFVVGMVQESVDKVNATPIEGTYFGTKTAAFLLPDDFDPSKVAPIFFPVTVPLPGVGDGMDVSGAIQAYDSAEKQMFCGARINRDWVVAASDYGFFATPHPDSSREARPIDQFSVEVIAQAILPNLAALVALEKTDAYVKTPFRYVPSTSDSLLIAQLNREYAGAVHRERVAFLLKASSVEIQVLAMLPRVFNRFQFNPDNNDAALLLCRAKRPKNLTFFLHVCQDLLGQIASTYYEADSPCVPGTAPR